MTELERSPCCTLPVAERQDRLEGLRHTLFAQMVSVDELDAGFRLWFDLSRDNLDMLAAFVDFESKCCGFLDFEIALRAGSNRVSLRLSGADPAKEILEKLISSVRR